MASIWLKRDRDGQVLHEGDVCVRITRPGHIPQFCVYKGESYGKKGGKGEYGKFITPDGVTSIKYTSVLFSFDPMGKRRADTEQVREMTRKFYEEK